MIISVKNVNVLQLKQVFWLACCASKFIRVWFTNAAEWRRSFTESVFFCDSFYRSIQQKMTHLLSFFELHHQYSMLFCTYGIGLWAAWSAGRCPWQGIQNQVIFKAPSNPNQCVILCMDLHHLLKWCRENPFEHWEALTEAGLKLHLPQVLLFEV